MVKTTVGNLMEVKEEKNIKPISWL